MVARPVLRAACYLLTNAVGPYVGSYGWRAVAILADIGRASLVARIPRLLMLLLARRLL
jgi:hypothetical protein